MEHTQINVTIPQSFMILLGSILFVMGISLITLMTQDHRLDIEAEIFNDSVADVTENTTEDPIQNDCHDKMFLVGGLNPSLSMECDDNAHLEKLFVNSNTIFVCRCQ